MHKKMVAHSQQMLSYWEIIISLPRNRNMIQSVSDWQLFAPDCWMINCQDSGVMRVFSVKCTIVGTVLVFIPSFLCNLVVAQNTLLCLFLSGFFFYKSYTQNVQTWRLKVKVSSYRNIIQVKSSFYWQKYHMSSNSKYLNTCCTWSLGFFTEHDWALYYRDRILITEGRRQRCLSEDNSWPIWRDLHVRSVLSGPIHLYTGASAWMQMLLWCSVLKVIPARLPTFMLLLRDEP